MTFIDESTFDLTLTKDISKEKKSLYINTIGNLSFSRINKEGITYIRKDYKQHLKSIKSLEKLSGKKIINRFNKIDNKIIISKKNKFNTSDQISYQIDNQIDVQINAKAADLGILLNETQLKNVLKQNPWEIDVKKTLEKVSARLHENSQIIFRIGGRVLLSTTHIVSAKAGAVIQQSYETQNDLQVNEVDEDDLYPEEEFLDDEGSSNIITEKSDPEAQKFFSKLNGGKNYLNGYSNIDFNLESDENGINTDNWGFINQLNSGQISDGDSMRVLSINHDAFFRVDRNGNRYLAGPNRKVYRKITFQDLSKALTRKIRLGRTRKFYKPNSEDTFSDNANTILPSNILKKAEEKRALVEERLEQMYQIILTKSTPESPVSFLDLIINPTPDGIVQTLLYLLHLVNRKAIDLWQLLDDESATEFIADKKKFSSKKKNDENSNTKDSGSSSNSTNQSDTIEEKRKKEEGKTPITQENTNNINVDGTDMIKIYISPVDFNIHSIKDIKMNSKKKKSEKEKK